MVFQLEPKSSSTQKERVRRTLSIFLAGMRSLTGAQHVFLLVVGGVMGLLTWLAVPGPRAAKAAQRLAEVHAEGRAGVSRDYVDFWIPRVALGELIFCALLLLGVKWLVHPLPTARILPRLQPKGRGRRFWMLTAAVIAWSAWMNAPRLDFSLWGDEESTMRKSVVGEYRQQDDGTLKWRGVSWQETVFRYTDPNNHIFQSILARASHEAFAKGTADAHGFYFDAQAMRLPVYFCGLAGLAALAWLGRTLGRPGVGLAAVSLMALHPWFVRYGVEARGYGVLLLLIPLALVSLVKAARTGGWGWWLGFGLLQFLILWSYPGALQLVMALNVSAIWVVLTPRTPRHWRVAQAGRWIVGTSLGALLSAMMLTPCVQPLAFYLKTERMRGGLSVSWLQDAGSLLLTGQTWMAWDPSNPFCYSWTQFLQSSPAVTLAGLVLLAVVWLLGLIWWWKQGGVARAMLPALTLMTPLMLAQSAALKNFLYNWYLMPALPGIVLVGAGGLMAVVQGFRTRPTTPGTVAAVALSGLFAWGTHAQRKVLREIPVERMKEGTKLTRDISLASDPRLSEVLTLDILMTPRGYDPAALPLGEDDPGLLKRYMSRADAEGKPLYAHYGHPGLANAVRPELMALIHNPALFDLVEILPGLDAPYTRLVYRYRPGSAASLSPEAAPANGKP